MLKRVLLLGLSFALSIAIAQASDIAGRASVIDGDTIEMHGQRIRLHGVDAPEKSQPCFRGGGSVWRCGQQSALALSDFLGLSPVSCQQVDTDRYGRIVADCYVRGADVQEWLVGAGWAMAYRRYSSAYVGAEQSAKNTRRGIRSGTVQAPWEWRRQSQNWRNIAKLVSPTV
jgi:endonuclease YncB( thermonuclease family)